MTQHHTQSSFPLNGKVAHITIQKHQNEPENLRNDFTLEEV